MESMDKKCRGRAPGGPEKGGGYYTAGAVDVNFAQGYGSDANSRPFRGMEMSLAVSTLLYEWRRYLAAVIALAVAGLLVLSMAGMFMGMGKTFTATIDRSPAEVMVLPPQAVTLFANNGGQPRRIIPGPVCAPGGPRGPAPQRQFRILVELPQGRAAAAGDWRSSRRRRTGRRLRHLAQ